MPTVRFVREGRDVQCAQGANLREIALGEGVEIYGLKGKLGNCKGYGQCITCLVRVLNQGTDEPVSPISDLEAIKLKNRPKDWRLACQTVVNESVIVVTRPQASFKNSDLMIKQAKSVELPH